VDALRTDLSWLVRLVAAAVLAGIVGWEREKARKRAGLRTHVVVGVSSALFVAVSQLAAYEVHGPEGSLRVEPIQIIQAIAVGIGFLGSGVIRAADAQRGGAGLTTAASVWGTAAIGIAAALEHYALALGASLLLVLVLRGMERFEPE
jgi:putative Mg2+ transporter-C (MgtC) family protein